MNEVGILSAFRKALQSDLHIFVVFAVLSSLPLTGMTAALSMQWSVGGRFVDLERLLLHHVRWSNTETLVILAEGKTDRAGRGQPIPVPLEGPEGQMFLQARNWLLSRTGNQRDLVFP
eukprot:TRINITY_DN15355_c2_g1_i4.p2 TRINITY_DN15355_c2_g1~~TRINITY_DN15355_c2_g1_i4.p2  ORF type:complete len:118 (-),score=6.31 TRINITY_DN15355_c2_g1_i4:535-888(-)